jgi:hypothetical protein
MQNFTVADLLQTTLATFAFALFLLPPGYLLGLASNLFGFRSRSAAEKILFSAMLSVAVTPILAVLLTRFLSYKATLTVLLLLVLGSAATLVREFPPRPGMLSRIHRSTWLLLGMMLAWFVVVQLSLADLQVGHRLYVSFVTFDHSLRVPLVEAAARNGVPPRNPFYGLGKIPVLRYFYYWYVVCALPMRLLGLAARPCFNASVFWSGLGLASCIPLFLKYFLGETRDLREKSVIGIALLAVTGLDLIPYGFTLLHRRAFMPDMEWWDPNQVTSWLGSLLWVPHHVASLTASMAGLLVLSTIDERDSFCHRAWAVLLSGPAFASAAGLSVYVTFTFAVFAIAWALQTLWHRQRKTLATYIASGAISLLLSWPYLSDLLSKPAELGLGMGSGRGEQFAFFAIRDYPAAVEVLTRLGLHNSWLLELAKLPVLLFVYVLEFGFFGLVMVLCLRREWRNRIPRNRQGSMAWMMFVICLLTVSFLKSQSTSQNDLGFRGMLVVQFVLLIWSAPILYDIFFASDPAARSGLGAPWVRFALLCTLVVGVAGTAWELFALRAYMPLADAGIVERQERVLGSKGFAARTYWMREGYSRLDRLTTPGTSLQYNPVREEVMISQLNAPRQVVMGDAFCVSAFGGDVEKCRKAFPTVAKIFNDPEAVRSWGIDKTCSDFHINLLVATDADPVWKDSTSWVWNRPTLLSNPAVRAVPCGVPSLPPSR